MAFLEAAAPLLEGAGGEAGAGGLSGLSDFNDLPVGKMAGSIAGKVVHAAVGAIGTGGYPQERVSEGPVGNI